jgi:acetyltransferase-like isoleucine patch superfamily enzyme
VNRWSVEDGIQIAGNVPKLHPDSWVEAPVVIQAALAPMNLIQVGAFTGIYGGRLGHCNIGRYCSIAPGADIASDQHPSNWLSTSMIQYVSDVHGWGRWLQGRGEEYFAPSRAFQSNARVHIGNDVWIGQGVFIRSGVKIGDGAIIAAHSVVVEDVPAYAISAGVPAKVKRYRFEDKMIEQLLSLRWWDYNIMSVSGLDFSDVVSSIGVLGDLKEKGHLRPFLSTKFSF